MKDDQWRELLVSPAAARLDVTLHSQELALSMVLPPCAELQKQDKLTAFASGVTPACEASTMQSCGTPAGAILSSMSLTAREGSASNVLLIVLYAPALKSRSLPAGCRAAAGQGHCVLQPLAACASHCAATPGAWRTICRIQEQHDARGEGRQPEALQGMPLQQHTSINNGHALPGLADLCMLNQSGW